MSNRPEKSKAFYASNPDRELYCCGQFHLTTTNRLSHKLC